MSSPQNSWIHQQDELSIFSYPFDKSPIQVWITWHSEDFLRRFTGTQMVILCRDCPVYRVMNCDLGSALVGGVLCVLLTICASASKIVIPRDGSADYDELNSQAYALAPLYPQIHLCFMVSICSKHVLFRLACQFEKTLKVYFRKYSWCLPMSSLRQPFMNTQVCTTVLNAACVDLLKPRDRAAGAPAGGSFAEELHEVQCCFECGHLRGENFRRKQIFIYFYI